MDLFYNCILIGETGTGKSSFGNFLLGIEDAFKVSEDPKSCTTETIRKISQLDPEIGVVDTPGLQDSKGRDKIHYEQMLKIIKQMKNLNFILIVFNYTQPRLTPSIQYMIKFLCNVFPKNFSHHVGIVFTHYDHEYQIKISKKKNKDPRENKKEFIKEIMELISQTTNEELFLGPPVYYLDSYIEDDNSKEELNRLIVFAKNLQPIEDIRECNLKYKKEEDEFKTNTYDRVEGDCIYTYTEKLTRKKYTDYNGEVKHSDWKILNTDKTYKSQAVRYETRTVYVEREDNNENKDKKEEKKDKLTEQDELKPKEMDNKEICDKVIKGGFLATFGSGILTAGGALLSPICPAVGAPMVYAGLTGMLASEATAFGGMVADNIINN